MSYYGTTPNFASNAATFAPHAFAQSMGAVPAYGGQCGGGVPVQTNFHRIIGYCVPKKDAKRFAKMFGLV